MLACAANVLCGWQEEKLFRSDNEGRGHWLHSRLWEKTATPERGQGSSDKAKNKRAVLSKELSMVMGCCTSMLSTKVPSGHMCLSSPWSEASNWGTGIVMAHVASGYHIDGAEEERENSETNLKRQTILTLWVLRRRGKHQGELWVWSREAEKLHSIASAFSIGRVAKNHIVMDTCKKPPSKV